MNNLKEINDFFTSFYSNKREIYLEFEAERFGLTKENYWEIVLKPSEVEEKDFASIQLKLGLILPENFKTFYKAHYSLEEDFDVGGVFIAGNNNDCQLTSLRNYLFNHSISSDITALGLLPFGLFNDEWYICLNMNENPTDPSIVLFEMSNWGAGKDAISHRLWFSNFKLFLACFSNYQSNGDSDLFDEIDPNNNYLNAYDYWKK